MRLTGKSGYWAGGRRITLVINCCSEIPVALLGVTPAEILYLVGKTNNNFIKLTAPNANNNSVKS